MRSLAPTHPSYLLTGGGSGIAEKTDAVLDFVDSIAPHTDVEVPCHFDSTSVFEVKKGESFLKIT